MGEALDGLAAWVSDVDAQVPRLLDAAPLARVVAVLQRLEGLRRALQASEALLVRHVTRSAGTGKHEAGGIRFEVHGGWDRKEWRDSEVAKRLAVDPGSGELLWERPEVRTAVRQVLAAGRHEWRVTDLRGQGIDPDDEDDPLCRREPKRMTVQFLSGAEASK